MDKEKIRVTLKEKRLSKGLSAEKLGKTVGVNKTTIYRYEKGEIEKMPMEVANKLSTALDINPLYIIGLSENPKIDKLPNSNIHSIYNQLNEPNQAKVYNFAEKTLEEQNTNVIDLREYRDIDIQSTVSAGTGVVDLDANHIERISYNGFIPNKYDTAFRVQGDSMEPMFKDGEIVFVVKDEDVRNGQIGVVLIDGEAFVKKMYVEGDKLRLVSLNKQYKDIIANGSNQISVYGRVVL
ncbi:helix-turn-helix domain-containing protein [Vagococcus salmoninarum]|uniref:helix-turn-helix domain-containing protein n=1 Tax=Vagococcus salmoninarum TaxID=2739 RepID=UPI0018809429|nr:XRE family transcriptional regulator [Vagococcus salmoninarum]MBE9387877.1 LexA family transcriptional regulator [Vagococcus salmoninarum]